MTAYLVEGERARTKTIGPLNMRSDGQQIPEPLDGPKPLYFVGRGTFQGQVTPWHDGHQAEQSPALFEGRVGLAVSPHRVYAIVTPDKALDPCIWMMEQRTNLRVLGSGSQGMLKKRPTSIRIGQEQWSLTVREISSFLKGAGRYSTGQEAALLAALGAS